MTTYNLEILAYGSYLIDNPQLTIWNDGFIDTNHLIDDDGTTIDRTLTYSGALPSSVFFTFNDSSLEVGREINLRAVKINDRYISEANFLTSDVLVNGQASHIDMVNGAFLFDDSDPDTGLFSSPNITLDNNANTVRYLGGVNYTLDGLGGNDIFYIGAGDDQLYGNDGDDKIFAGAGDDLLMGGDGKDKLSGQDGNDDLYGGAGDDGNDRLFGGAGDDKVNGNDGDDLLVGQEGNDSVNGSYGNDIMYGDEGNDTLIGGDGLDTIDGGVGNDLIYAGNDNDIVYGGEGNDRIYGDAGDDILHGNEGVDSLSGRDGNDTLYGGIQGKKSLSGGDGDDILISSSDYSITAEINAILSGNAGVTYNPQTNSFYQFFSGAQTWDAAQTSANAITLTGLSGVQGDLVTITTQVENDYVEGLAGGADIWIGASDSNAEGDWSWLSGIENGTQFWLGGSAGSSVNSQYENWAFLNPLNLFADQDYAYMNGSGEWASARASTTNGYVVEWDARSLIELSDPLTFMNGDAGADELYGYNGGIDRFIIDTIDAVDSIYNFNVNDHDQLDISNILSFNDKTDDIFDFINLTENAGDTIISIDSDGADNGSTFTDIVRMEDVTGLDLALLVTSDSLLV